MSNIGKCCFSWFVWICEVYIWMIIIRIIASWFNPSPYNPIISPWFVVTEPAMKLLENYFPTLAYRGSDLSDLLIYIFLFAIIMVRHIYKLIGDWEFSH